MRKLLSVFAGVFIIITSCAADSLDSKPVYGPTTSDDHLWQLAQVLNPDPKTLSTQQVMIAFLRYNREAFDSHNVNALRPGYNLKLPQTSEIQKISRETAVNEVASQNAAWRKSAQPNKYFAPSKKNKLPKKKIIKKELLINAHNSFTNSKAVTINSAVAKAVKNNPETWIKIKAWLAANKGIRVAQSGYLPKVDLSGQIGREHLNDSSTDNHYLIINPIDGDVALSQMIFDGFNTSSQVAINRNRTLSQAYQLQSTANDIALLATKAYLDIIRTKKITKFAEDNYQMHLQTYNAQKATSEKGLEREANINQAAGRLALAKANLYSAQNNYDDAIATFVKIVGNKPDGEFIIPENPKDYVLPASVDIALKNALKDHPLIKSAQANIDEAKAERRATQANFYPQVDAIASASHGHDIDNLPGRHEDQSIQLRLKYNLFNGGNDQASVQQAAFFIEQAQQEKDRTANEIKENLHFSWDAALTVNEQLEYFKKHQAAAEATVIAYRKQFRVGQRALIDLLDAEDELFSAESDYITGILNQTIAKYRILHAQGKLLDYFQIPIPYYAVAPERNYLMP